MNFMVVVRGREREMSSPLFYTHYTVVWGAPGALSATKDVIGFSNVISMSRGAGGGAGVDRVRRVSVD